LTTSRPFYLYLVVIFCSLSFLAPLRALPKIYLIFRYYTAPALYIYASSRQVKETSMFLAKVGEITCRYRAFKVETTASAYLAIEILHALTHNQNQLQHSYIDADYHNPRLQVDDHRNETTRRMRGTKREKMRHYTKYSLIIVRCRRVFLAVNKINFKCHG
jgi:hypothetical protein